MNNAKTKSCPKESFLAPLSINRLWTVTSWDESYGSWACRESRSTKGAKVLCMQTLCQLIILLHCYFRVVSLGWKCVDLLTNLTQKSGNWVWNKSAARMSFLPVIWTSRAFWTASESCFRRRAFKCDQTVATANWSFNDVQWIACYSWLCLRTSQNYCILMMCFSLFKLLLENPVKVLSACALS